MFQILPSRHACVAMALACALGSAWAQPLHVEDAWARATVPGQKAGSAFMTLRAEADLVLTGASSPAAETAEFHSMEQDGDIMRMRALPEIRIAAGQAVHLTPSETHIMLMNLHQPLAEGHPISLTLRGRTAGGEAVTQTVEIPVLSLLARDAGQPHAMPGHDH